ncbi:MAG TPA: protein-export chaperone SecB [Gammaproteobacteria bacterium]|nr:protein-export chaperone SecB [Gammaproteobacteria bacterium]
MANTEKSEQTAQEKQFAVQNIYTKDISFESPNSPHIFREQMNLNINLQVSNNATVLAENIHEVVLSITVTAKLGEKEDAKTAYLVEIQQAGIFQITGFSQQELGAMVGSYCPNLLFPYAREAISSMVSKGGFPQLLLAPLNFDALYEQHLNRLKQQKDESGETTH